MISAAKSAYMKKRSAAPGFREARRAKDAARRATPEGAAARRAYDQLVSTKNRKRAKRGMPLATRPEPQLCESCGDPPGIKGLGLDHDHETGAFRGWLCTKCNSGIGMLGDNLDGLDRARAYVIRNTPC